MFVEHAFDVKHSASVAGPGLDVTPPREDRVMLSYEHDFQHDPEQSPHERGAAATASQLVNRVPAVVYRRRRIMVAAVISAVVLLVVLTSGSADVLKQSATAAPAQRTLVDSVLPVAVLLGALALLDLGGAVRSRFATWRRAISAGEAELGLGGVVDSWVGSVGVGQGERRAESGVRDVLRSRGPQISGEERVVTLDEVGEFEMQRRGQRRAVDESRAHAARDQRRDGEAQLVDEVGVRELRVERGAAFGQDHLSAATGQFREDRLSAWTRSRELNHLGERLESREVGVRDGAASDDQGSVLVRSALGQQRQARIEVSARADHSQARTLVKARGETSTACRLLRARQSVTLDARGVCGHEDPVGTSSHSREDGFVSGIAKLFASSAYLDRSVSGGDHVEHHPRSQRRLGAIQERVDVHRNDVDDRIRQQSSHVAKVPPSPRSVA